jgi:lysozyme
MLHMTPSPWLWAFIKQWERFRPTAYPATADERRRGIWTIGWGHTAGVKEGDTCTQAQAQEWLQDDVAAAVLAVCRDVTVPLNQNQFDALVSLCFNIGIAHFAGCGLLKYVNAGNFVSAAADFINWDKQSGQVIDGLETRRTAEATHFRLPA